MNPHRFVATRTQTRCATLGYRNGMGFTLIELVVTLAILGLLASAAVPMLQLASERAKEAELREDLREIRTAIDRYKAAADAHHIQVSIDGTGYPPSLSVLAAGVTDIQSISGRKLYFLRRVPRDPFAANDGSADESWGLRSYDSPPDQPASGKDVFDVYSRSNKVGLNGVPYRRW